MGTISVKDASGATVTVARIPDTGQATAANSLPMVLASDQAMVPVDTLATLGVARQLAAGAASANTALTTTCRRISIHANGAAIRYVIGTGAQTASATSHYIASSERLDLDVPASAQIAVIRAGATDGVLELSELV